MKNLQAEQRQALHQLTMTIDRVANMSNRNIFYCFSENGDYLIKTNSAQLLRMDFGPETNYKEVHSREEVRAIGDEQMALAYDELLEE